ERHGGTPGHVRPGGGNARGPGGRRADPGRTDGGGGDAPGDGGSGMIRVLGVLGLLVALYAGLVGTYVQNAPGSEPAAKTQERVRGNLIDVANIQGRYGVITLGAALVIITGGIDLSVGAVVGCAAVLFGVLTESGVHPFAAVPLVVLFGALVGLGNGLLITGLKLQPFLVTLCGMFAYRGVARLLAGPVS